MNYPSIDFGVDSSQELKKREKHKQLLLNGDPKTQEFVRRLARRYVLTRVQWYPDMAGEVDEIVDKIIDRIYLNSPKSKAAKYKYDPKYELWKFVFRYSRKKFHEHRKLKSVQQRIQLTNYNDQYADKNFDKFSDDLGQVFTFPEPYALTLFLAHYATKPHAKHALKFVILILRVNGLSDKEIAEGLGTTIGSIRSSISQLPKILINAQLNTEILIDAELLRGSFLCDLAKANVQAVHVEQFFKYMFLALLSLSNASNFHGLPLGFQGLLKLYHQTCEQFSYECLFVELQEQIIANGMQRVKKIFQYERLNQNDPLSRHYLIKSPLMLESHDSMARRNSMTDLDILIQKAFCFFAEIKFLLISYLYFSLSSAKSESFKTIKMMCYDSVSADISIRLRRRSVKSIYEYHEFFTHGSTPHGKEGSTGNSNSIIALIADSLSSYKQELKRGMQELNKASEVNVNKVSQMDDTDFSIFMENYIHDYIEFGTLQEGVALSLREKYLNDMSGLA